MGNPNLVSPPWRDNPFRYIASKQRSRLRSSSPAPLPKRAPARPRRPRELPVDQGKLGAVAPTTAPSVSHKKYLKELQLLKKAGRDDAILPALAQAVAHSAVSAPMASFALHWAARQAGSGNTSALAEVTGLLRTCQVAPHPAPGTPCPWEFAIKGCIAEGDVSSALALIAAADAEASAPAPAVQERQGVQGARAVLEEALSGNAPFDDLPPGKSAAGKAPAGKALSVQSASEDLASASAPSGKQPAANVPSETSRCQNLPPTNPPVPTHARAAQGVGLDPESLLSARGLIQPKALARLLEACANRDGMAPVTLALLRSLLLRHAWAAGNWMREGNRLREGSRTSEGNRALDHPASWTSSLDAIPRHAMASCSTRDRDLGRTLQALAVLYRVYTSDPPHASFAHRHHLPVPHGGGPRVEVDPTPSSGPLEAPSPLRSSAGALETSPLMSAGIRLRLRPKRAASPPPSDAPQPVNPSPDLALVSHAGCSLAPTDADTSLGGESPTVTSAQDSAMMSAQDCEMTVMAPGDATAMLHQDRKPTRMQPATALGPPPPRPRPHWLTSLFWEHVVPLADAVPPGQGRAAAFLDLLDGWAGCQGHLEGGSVLGRSLPPAGASPPHGPGVGAGGSSPRVDTAGYGTAREDAGRDAPHAIDMHKVPPSLANALGGARGAGGPPRAPRLRYPPPRHVLNSLAHEASRRGDYAAAAAFARHMASAGLRPDAYTYAALVKAAPNPQVAASLVRHMHVRSRLKPSRVVYNCLLYACAREGYHVTAQRLVTVTMPQRGVTPDVISYTTWVLACAVARNTPAAFHAMATMRAAGVRPNLWTYTALLSACAFVGDISCVDDVIADMASQGFHPERSVVVGTLAAQGAAFAGDVNGAIARADAMRGRGLPLSIVTANALIRAFANTNSLAGVLATMDWMGAVGLKPNEETLRLQAEWMDFQAAAAATAARCSSAAATASMSSARGAPAGMSSARVAAAAPLTGAAGHAADASDVADARDVADDDRRREGAVSGLESNLLFGDKGGMGRRPTEVAGESAGGSPGVPIGAGEDREDMDELWDGLTNGLSDAPASGDAGSGGTGASGERYRGHVAPGEGMDARHLARRHVNMALDMMAGLQREREEGGHLADKLFAWPTEPKGVPQKAKAVDSLHEAKSLLGVDQR
eukprot:jgi/Mesvir1/15859/Mv03405-RA.1